MTDFLYYDTENKFVWRCSMCGMFKVSHDIGVIERAKNRHDKPGCKSDYARRKMARQLRRDMLLNRESNHYADKPNNIKPDKSFIEYLNSIKTQKRI